MRTTSAGPDSPRAAAFSTVGLPAAQRLEKWEAYNASALVALACRTINGAPLEATERNLWLPHVEVAQVTGTPHVVERTARQIDRHPSRAVVLYLAMAGEAFFYHDDGVRVLKPGQAVLCDADVPFVRGFAQGLTELVLKVPRPVFDGLSEGTALRTPRVFDIAGPAGAGGHGYALARRLRSMVRGEAGEDRQLLERELLGLLRTMVCGARAGDTRSQLHAAQAFVERDLTDRNLSAARIAAGIGISERQLSRIFSEHGGVARWITDRRLDRAKAMLAAGDDRLSIGEVSHECGFASQSYFARVFKQRFAMTPLEFVRGARS
ncbi:AraC family transcriptional regulator [Amycolatopsis acidicola]|uniref:AraC family transcriptional regulator n=1 Tax=Amycolatopsis acidicola TaxID=2596893 RepID=UPI00140DC72F|nr:AraC family transcriptional regulator [Amycolatopsis acidicola]